MKLCLTSYFLTINQISNYKFNLKRLLLVINIKNINVPY